jgi:hypothetical protein
MILGFVAQFGAACGNAHTGDMSMSGGDNTNTVTQLEVTNAAYRNLANSADLKVAGSVPSGRLSFLYVTFFDPAGSQVEVDTNGDGKPDTATMNVPVDNDATGQTFFVDIALNESMVANIHRLGIQVVDENGDLSNTVYADLNDIPQVSLGALCDLRGFNSCPIGSGCKESTSDWQARCIGDSVP